MQYAMVPPAGKTGVFSFVKDERVARLSMPRRQAVLVLETKAGESAARAGQLVRELSLYNHLQTHVFDGDLDALSWKFSGIAPRFVMLPHPDAVSPAHTALHEAAKDFLHDTTVIYYETPKINDPFNLYVLFDEAGMEHKMRCIAPFKSQLERVRFDLAAKYAARQAALEIRPLLSPEMQKYKYAERFVMAGFLPNDPKLHFLPAERKAFLTPAGSWKVWCGLKTDFYSPHHDDLEIPAAFTVSMLAEKGSLVHNFVLTTGKEGVAGDMPWVQKHLLRNRELAEASALEGVVPIDMALLHDFPESRPQPQWKDGAGMIITGFMKRFNPRMLFLPFEHDGHPDHKLTFELINKIAKRAQDDGYWTQAGFPNVLLYASPWYSGPSGTNVYLWFNEWQEGRNEASKYACMVNAIVGTELAMNRPGATPPTQQDFGGKYAEKYLIQRF